MGELVHTSLVVSIPLYFPSHVTMYMHAHQHALIDCLPVNGRLWLHFIGGNRLELCRLCIRRMQPPEVNVKYDYMDSNYFEAPIQPMWPSLVVIGPSCVIENSPNDPAI